MKKSFVHLHLHTKYSILDGACHIKPLVARARELGMPAVAMTDHGVMYGAIEFYKECEAQGIKPIIGCEVYINGQAHRTAHDRSARYYHLVLLARDEEGYRNLAKINSVAHLEGFYYKPRIDKETLRAHARGLIGLSACLQGEVNMVLLGNRQRNAEPTMPPMANGYPEDQGGGSMEGILRESPARQDEVLHANGLEIQEELEPDITVERMAEAERVALEYKEIFGAENFYLEMQDHGLREQRMLNPAIREIARRTGLRTVITNDVHYLRQEHAMAHDIMLCIQTGTVISDPDRMRYATDQFYFKTRQELEVRFPDDADALDATLEIAERCNLKLQFYEGDPATLHFPSYQVPAGFASQQEYLVHLGKRGINKLYAMDFDNPVNEYEREVVERFLYEVGIIKETGFINYFLVVADFMRWSRENGVPTGPGRGSGAGSLLAYSLGITQIDPIRFDLIFERFLNPERVSAPDFDIDFCQSERGRVIEYVKEKYGQDHVAQIVTFNQLAPKAVIRDIARALQIPLQEALNFTKMIPKDPKITTLQKARTASPQFDKACEENVNLMTIMRHAEVLEGLCRNPGVHAAGVIISDKPLQEVVPLGKDKEGAPVTQYDMKWIEACGFLKMDFLGLKTITVLSDAVKLVQTLHGRGIEVSELPLDDPKTFALLQRAETAGLFQLESDGMQNVLSELQPTRIEEIIAILALYRPGPMAMIPTFIKRKKGVEPIHYDHPLLEPVLKETYGIMVYQEQVQRAAQVLAGYTLGAADVLRRAMGKKDPLEMAHERKTFVKGCMEKNNIPPKLAGEIFDSIEKFAGYGFNKAHATVYAMISYQTAYLKAHYPAEFMCAQITSEIGDSEKFMKIINATEDMGIKVRPPSVNSSFERFLPRDGSILYGLAGIKNVGQGAAEAIVSEREANGPYQDAMEFCVRLDSTAVNKRALESLIKCGALDEFGVHRARLFNSLDLLLSAAAEKLREQASGQGNLFDMLAETTPQVGGLDELPQAPPWPERELLSYERELLGLYMSGHPMARYQRLARAVQSVSLANLDKCADQREVRVTGIAESVQMRVSKKKEQYAVIQLADEEASVEVLVFPKVLKSHDNFEIADKPLLVCGILRKEDKAKILVEEIYLLQDGVRAFCERAVASIEIGDTAGVQRKIEALQEVIKLFPGKTPLHIQLVFTDGRKVMVQSGESFSIEPNLEFISEAEGVLGRNHIRLIFRQELFRKPRPTRARYS